MKRSLLSAAFVCLILTLLSSQAYAFRDECGVEWTTTMTRRMGVSPARVVIVENAVEVEPNHWVSTSPKGGNIYINFGQDMGEVFARKNSGFFQWSNALVPKDILDQWAADSASLAFRHKIDVSWSVRVLPSFQGIHAHAPAQRNLASGMEFGCRSPAGWTDPDGKNWYEAIVAAKGKDFWGAFRDNWGARPGKVIQATNLNQWYSASDGYTVSFDPSFCNTHLGSGIQFAYWRELYLDDWKFDIYETADPSAVNECPK